MENRHGLLLDFTVSQATSTAERGYLPRPLEADRGYDTQDCVADMRARRVTPYVA